MIKIITVGNIKEKYIKDAIEEYITKHKVLILKKEYQNIQR